MENELESHRPYSQACENNKKPILACLRELLAPGQRVLEIGSGSGQHGRYFAQQLPQVIWQCSDVATNLAGIETWREGYSGENLPAAVELDVRAAQWNVVAPDLIFTANSLHIMAWSAVQALFYQLEKFTPHSQRLCIYGPFNYAGLYTSDSNAQFDQWLAQRNPDSAIRDFEAVDELAVAAGYALERDYEMPANNRLLVWRVAD